MFAIDMYSGGHKNIEINATKKGQKMRYNISKQSLIVNLIMLNITLKMCKPCKMTSDFTQHCQ